jgi:hypothetical protein
LKGIRANKCSVKNPSKIIGSDVRQRVVDDEKADNIGSIIFIYGSYYVRCSIYIRTVRLKFLFNFFLARQKLGVRYRLL